MCNGGVEKERCDRKVLKKTAVLRFYKDKWIREKPCKKREKEKEETDEREKQ